MRRCGSGVATTLACTLDTLPPKERRRDPLELSATGRWSAVFPNHPTIRLS